MEFDEERYDNRAFGPLLPPDDRLWRHPSELGRPSVAATAAGPSRMWVVAILAGAVGAVLAAGVGYAAGGLRSRTVPEPAVEHDLMSPVSLASTIGTSGFVSGSRRAQPSCVVLVAHDAHGLRLSVGVIVRSDGVVITAAHTVTGAQSVTATVGGTRHTGAKIIASDPASDLAVLKLDGHGFEAAPLGSALDIRVGDPVLVMHPLGTSAGDAVPGDQASVSGLGREVGASDGTRLDDLMEIGMSEPSSAAGTPLLDSRGAVIGITVAFGPAGRAVSYATPIDLAHEVEQQLLKGDHVVPVWLGIEGSDLSPEKAKALGVAGGAVVSKVAPDSPAQMAGLRPGDIVVGLDGRVVASMANLIMAVHARPPMTQVELALLRGTETQTFTARLSPRPPNS